MAARAELPPPGWHDDPWAPGARRYWDGERWTGHVMPATPAAPGRWTRPAGATRDAVWDLLWNPRLWPSWVPWIGAVERTGDDARSWRLGGSVGGRAFSADVVVEVTLRREVRLHVAGLSVDGAAVPAGWDAALTIADGAEGIELVLTCGAAAPEAPAAAEEVLSALAEAAQRGKRFVSAILERPKLARVARRDDRGNRPAGPATLAFKAGWGRRK